MNDTLSSTAGPSVDGPGEQAEVSALLAAALEQARAAVVDGLEPEAGAQVGEHLGVRPEPGGAATHRFAAEVPGYRGWEWAVVVAATPDATELDEVTVSEVVLLPGADALVSPGWVPWSERVRAGDLGAGDLLPPAEDDERLVPAYLDSDDPAVTEVALEIGLGRVHVMSRDGRLDTAERWEAGRTGPRSDWAKATDLTCGSCGFYLRMAGSLGAAFGVCGNELAADGHVVHAEHGCGAHSEVEVEVPPVAPVTALSYDDTELEVSTIPPRAVEQTPGDPVESGEDASGAPESHPDAPDADAPLDPDKSVEQDEPARQE